MKYANKPFLFVLYLSRDIKVCFNLEETPIIKIVSKALRNELMHLSFLPNYHHKETYVSLLFFAKDTAITLTIINFL